MRQSAPPAPFCEGAVRTAPLSAGRATAIALAALALAGVTCAPARGPAARAPGAGPRYFGDVSPPRENVLTFTNGAEPEMIDPGVLAGQPDGRVARAIFEGLTVPDPRTLEPLPGQAYRWEVGADGRVYTFHLRPGLRWSDGTPLGARDFLWSWLRVLRPETASRNAGLLYPVDNAHAFNQGRIEDEARVGLSAPDDSTFVVRLAQPTPYFLFLTQFYTFVPVPRAAVEAFGRRWTRPENIVGNGPFVLDKWRQGDRFEFVKNPLYWDAGAVRLDRVIALSVDDINTATNLYKAGVVDWNTSGNIPSQFVPYLRGYSDFQTRPYQGVYFYSFNCTRKPFDDVWVRRAFAFAVNREAIARDLLKGTRDPWSRLVPSGYPGYQPPVGQVYDPARARACLARAGFPGGRGFPRFSILFNTSEDHRRIAEAIQAMWKKELGVNVELANQEWGSYLQATLALQYDVTRRSWIGDYLDPNTFLACFRTGDGNNRTGWSDPRYDRLLEQAAAEIDPARRAAIQAQSEVLLLDEAPIIPIYHYSTTELVKPYVRGLYPNPLDTHPLKQVWIDREWKP